MKLKKVASLALAGLMAVSMLAGCGDNSSNGNGNGNVVVDPTTSVVSAVNNGQSVANDVKLTFKSDASLNSALEKAVELYGDTIINANGNFASNKIANAIVNLTALEQKMPADDGFGGTNSSEFFGSTRPWEDTNDDGKDDNKLDGKTYTKLYVNCVGAKNEQAALNMIAKAVDETVAKLEATTFDKDTTGIGDHYYDYSYTGNVSMVSATIDLTNTPVYVYAYTITQTVAEMEF